MIFQGPPTRGMNMSQSLYSDLANQYLQQGMQFYGNARQTRQTKFDPLNQALERLKAERLAKKAQQKKGTGGWASVAGTVGGALLAIPTGGLSLAAGAAIGGGIGSGIDMATAGNAAGAGQAISRGLTTGMGIQQADRRAGMMQQQIGQADQRIAQSQQQIGQAGERIELTRDAQAETRRHNEQKETQNGRWFLEYLTPIQNLPQGGNANGMNPMSYQQYFQERY